MYGQEFLICTDHQPLKWMFNLKEPQPRVARWIMKLGEYQFQIEYKPGKINGNADGLSRWPMEETDEVEKMDKEEDIIETIPGVNVINFVDYVPNPQLDDKDLVDIIDWKTQSEIRPDGKGIEGDLKTLWHQWERLRVINGVLYRAWKVNGDTIKYQYVVPKDKRREILEQMHDSEFGGHFGKVGTTGKIESRYYWPGQHKQIENYVQRCLKCQEAKLRGLLDRAPLQPIITSKPFQLVTCDILGPLPKTERGAKYILVFICHFTKWVEIYGINTLEAVEVARCLIDLICRHGSPEGLLSDQGRNFESALFKEVCELLDVHKLRTTPYHPQCDGLTERFNRTLISMLKIFVNQNQDDWDLLLNKLAFAYRTTVNRMTGQTPFEMVYGRQPKLPIDLFFPNEAEPIELDHGEYVKEVKERLTLMFELVQLDKQVKLDKSKIAYDRKVRGCDYEVGDKAWLINSEKKKGVSPKLMKAWKGPYEIIEKLGPVNYKIKFVNGKKKVVVHKNRLKKCFMDVQGDKNVEISASQNVDITVVEDNVDSVEYSMAGHSNPEPQVDLEVENQYNESPVPSDLCSSSRKVGEEVGSHLNADDPCAILLSKPKRGRPKKNVVIDEGRNNVVQFDGILPSRIQPSRVVKRN